MARLQGLTKFKPSGAVSAAFIRDQRSKVKALLGPGCLGG